MTRTSATTVRRAAAAKLAELGQDHQQIADTLGVTVAVIRRGLGLPTEQEERITARQTRVRELVAEGIAPSNIAATLDVTYWTVIRDIRQLGLTPDRAADRAARRARVVDLTRGGHSLTTIADMLNISEHTVGEDLQKMGEPTPHVADRARKHARIEALTLDGWSIEAIAAEIGMSKSAVFKHRKRAGITKPTRTSTGRARHVTDTDIASARARIETDGLTFTAAAREIGCHPTTLRSHLPDVAPGKRGPRTVATSDDQLFDLWDRAVSGENVTRLAKEVGISRPTLIDRWEKAGYRDLTAARAYADRIASRTADAETTTLWERAVAGERVHEIAARLGTTQQALNARFAAAGLTGLEAARREARNDRMCPLGCGRPADHRAAPAFTSGVIRLAACEGTRSAAA